MTEQSKQVNEHNALRCTSTYKAQLEPSDSLEWTVHMENTGASTIHVSHQIQSFSGSPDGTVLEVSTIKPVFADNVHITFFSLPTVPLDPGQILDQPYKIEFPLSFARFTGFPPRIESEEWVPAATFEVRMTIAYGEQPFYPPVNRNELASALQRWTRVVNVPNMQISMKKAKED